MKYFDLHADTPYECYRRGEELSSDNLAVSIEASALFDSFHQTFAFWIPDNEPKPYSLYRRMMEDFKKKCKGLPDNFSFSFSVENAKVIERDIGRLYEIKNDGVNMLTLTWNGENLIAGGCKSEQGLTRFGKGVIKEMNKLGMVVDVSHLNDKSFFGVINIAERVVASHSLCRSVFEHKRNLTDEQIKLIAQKGGLIGVCFFPGFLGGDTFLMLHRHIYHLLEMGLENNIAIGSDFDGAAMDTRLCSTADVKKLYFTLSEMGLTDRVLDKIFYENAKEYMLNL